VISPQPVNIHDLEYSAVSQKLMVSVVIISVLNSFYYYYCWSQFCLIGNIVGRFNKINQHQM